VLQCVAVCCSVLQCVAVCCSVLQCVAVCCRASHTHDSSCICDIMSCVHIMTHPDVTCICHIYTYVTSPSESIRMNESCHISDTHASYHTIDTYESRPPVDL